MNMLVIYHNMVLLPTQDDPQTMLGITSPSLQKWYITLPTYIGINRSENHWELAFVILGFGFIFNKNWDV